MAVLQPVDVMDNGDVPGFDTSVITIDRAGTADGSVFEIICFLLVAKSSTSLRSIP